MHISKGLFLPRVDSLKCTNCSICINSCPGYSVDFSKINKSIFQKQPTNELIGNYLNCYIGHGCNTQIRFCSSSGGITTELLIFALDTGVIDGVVVTKMNELKPFEPKPFIARTRAEVIEASRSKYCPVPLNATLKQIISEKGKFAVVGLPCHIHGVRKAEQNIKGLKEKIVLHVGLMCSHNVNLDGTKFILDNLRIKKEDVVEIRYRGMGWPGSMLIKKNNGSSFKIPYVGNWHSYWPVFSSFFFTPIRCLKCSDQTNELADLSVGDAWLPELKADHNGESIIVSRTEIAEKLLFSALKEERICLKPIKVGKVLQSQESPLRFKKSDFAQRMRIIKLFGNCVPIFYSIDESSMSFAGSFRAVYSYFNSCISSNHFFRAVMVNIPLPIFRLYYGFYKFLP